MDYERDFMKVKPTGVPLESGVMLISTPFFNDTFFNHSVVLLLETGKEGSVGLILNKRTGVNVTDVKPSWHLPHGPAHRPPLHVHDHGCVRAARARLGGQCEPLG